MSETRPVQLMILMDYFVGPHGGTERQVHELATNLDPQQWHVHFTVFRREKNYQGNDQGFGPTMQILGIHRLASVRTLVRMFGLARFIRKERVRIVHIFFNDAAIIGPLFCRLGGARVITSRRDMGFWYRPWRLAALRCANLFVDQIVANSEAVKENVFKREKFSPDKITVIRNSCDEAKFLEPAQPGFREQWGIGMDDPVIGMVANISPVKRYSDLLRAFALVRQRHPQAWLIVVGGGGPREVAETLTQALHLRLADRVRLLGSVPQPVAVMKHFDVAVLCSESEGLSNTIIEYMGCGKPTVCTATGGNTELVTHGRTGYLVPVGDVEQLAKYIIRLIEQPDLAVRLGRAAELSFRNGPYNTRTSIEAYQSLYRRLLTSG
ncbi:MAG: glycosyltransferase [Desulfobulbus sp.]|nr:glycosyltransferase [Desulfobulbus sp.]